VTPAPRRRSCWLAEKLPVARAEHHGWHAQAPEPGPTALGEVKLGESSWVTLGARTVAEGIAIGPTEEGGVALKIMDVDGRLVGVVINPDGQIGRVDTVAP
jgi:hypothetical protein